jgi:predicted Zn-dependent peptidase
MILNVESQTELSGFYVVYNRTAINETDGIHGISHLVEHLMSHNFDDKLIEEFQNNGISWNAYTSPTNIVFYLNGLDKHVSKYREQLLEKLSYIDIKEKDFEMEKTSLLEEYTGIFNMQGPSHLLNLYRKVLNSYNSIGKKEDILKLTQEQCKDYYLKYYTKPSKIINVSKNYMFESNIEFNNFKNDYIIQYDIRNDADIEEYKTLLNKSSVIYLSPIVKEQWATIFFINFLLSNGLSSPLYKNIRKKSGLAYYIRCTIDRLSDYSGINIISTETDDYKVDELMKRIDETLKDTFFLNESKFQQVKSSILNKIDTVEINRYSNVETYIKPKCWAIEDQINNITLDDVKEMYNKYYDVNNFYKSIDKLEFRKN